MPGCLRANPSGLADLALPGDAPPARVEQLHAEETPLPCPSHRTLRPSRSFAHAARLLSGWPRDVRNEALRQSSLRTTALRSRRSYESTTSTEGPQLVAIAAPELIGRSDGGRADRGNLPQDRRSFQSHWCAFQTHPVTDCPAPPNRASRCPATASGFRDQNRKARVPMGQQAHCAQVERARPRTTRHDGVVTPPCPT